MLFIFLSALFESQTHGGNYTQFVSLSVSGWVAFQVNVVFMSMKLFCQLIRPLSLCFN